MKSLKWICVLVPAILLAQPPAQAPATKPAAAGEAVGETKPISTEVPLVATDLAPAPAPEEAAAPAPVRAKAFSNAQAPAPGSSADLMRAAIQKQRLAARQQAQSTGAWLLPWADEVSISGPPPCDPIPVELATHLIEAAAKATHLEAPLLHALIEQESGFRPCAVSSKGAQGLMQLMPDTAGSLGVTDPFDAEQNIEAGSRYLKQLVDKYKGDIRLALGAYNAGPATVDAAGAVPNIQETKDYVEAILKKIK
jgi:soluble lytic murein transglycosylase-like protein